MAWGNTEIAELIKALFAQISMLFLLIFLLSKTRTFRNSMLQKGTTYRGKAVLILFFGVMAIFGTENGIWVNGAYANTRAMSVIAGGLVGGPLVGIGAGLVASVHRLTLGGSTIFSSSFSAVVEGVLAGYFAGLMARKPAKWAFALAVGFILEALHMSILLFFSESPAEAASFVSLVGIPAIVFNSVGVAAIVGALDSLFQERDKIEGVAAHVSLKIADQALAFLRDGLHQQSAQQTANIILDHVRNLNAVAITSQDKVLAFSGAGEDHHLPARPNDQGIQTASTKKALQTKQYQVAQTKDEIGCPFPGCPLKSKVVVPLLEYDQVIGALVLYRVVEYGITQFDVELALGLARIISSQLEMGKREKEKILLAQAELRALQAQINPHFLFNALNTIANYCRKQPDTARTLLGHLAGFYRGSLVRNDILVGLDKELEHIESYVKIEKARFQGKLEVAYDIPPDCNCMLPPLILQPLIENSLRHGLYPKREGGKVTICASRRSDLVYIMVEDTGVGIDEEMIKTILQPDRNRDSIGLSNVNERLKLVYPGNPGLSIDSRRGVGTKVTITIPVGKERPDATDSTAC